VFDFLLFVFGHPALRPAALTQMGEGRGSVSQSSLPNLPADLPAGFGEGNKRDRRDWGGKMKG